MVTTSHRVRRLVIRLLIFPIMNPTNRQVGRLPNQDTCRPRAIEAFNAINGRGDVSQAPRSRQVMVLNPRSSGNNVRLFVRDRYGSKIDHRARSKNAVFVTYNGNRRRSYRCHRCVVSLRRDSVSKLSTSLVPKLWSLWLLGKLVVWNDVQYFVV